MFDAWCVVRVLFPVLCCYLFEYVAYLVDSHTHRIIRCHIHLHSYTTQHTAHSTQHTAHNTHTTSSTTHRNHRRREWNVIAQHTHASHRIASPA